MRINFNSITSKMKKVAVAIVLFSLVLSVCECVNVKNATLIMLPDAVNDVSIKYTPLFVLQTLLLCAGSCLSRWQPSRVLPASRSQRRSQPRPVDSPPGRRRLVQRHRDLLQQVEDESGLVKVVASIDRSERIPVRYAVYQPTLL